MVGAPPQDEDGKPAVLRHVLAHTVIRVGGDRAWTRAQWFEMANDGPGKSLKMGTFGIYEDELERALAVLLRAQEAQPDLAPALEALQARVDEQDRAVRHVLTMLIEWFEGEAPREAA